MKKTSIMSDTKGKLKKMITGVVFSDPYVFVTEFFQNSYRAKAKNLYITYDKVNGEITFKDDGNGLKKEKDILTLDYSSWDSTTEGFGVGFWSWLGLDLQEKENNFTEVICKVRSNKFSFEMSKLDLLKSKIDVSIKEIEKSDGFEVTLSSELLKNEYVASDIASRIYSDGELMPYNIYYNNIYIEQKDILSGVSGVYVKNFNNRLFNARLSVSRRYDPLKIYYEKRKVSDYYNQSNVSGNIELNKNTLSLREPDRKDYARDNKYYKFYDKVAECTKELYKEFIENSTSEMIDEYSEKISEILEVKDYERLLEIEDIIYEVEEETRIIESNYEVVNELNTLINRKNEETEEIILDTTSTDVDNYNISKLLNILNIEDSKKWVQTEETVKEIDKWETVELTEEELTKREEVVIRGKVWKKIDEDNIKSFTREDEVRNSEVTFKSCNKKRKKSGLLEVIKKEKKRVWVKASEVEEVSDLIAKANYYGLKVFIAKNILYENVFKNKGIAHISEVDTGITKRNVIKNVGIKTNKEKSFLELLQPVCKYYDLPYDTFLIGDLELYLETKLQNVVVHREVIKNTKEKIKIYGLTDGNNIVFDRRALRLRRINLSQSQSMGIQEYRMLLSVINTLSHELAHYLYGTVDNTIEHYEKQDKIMEEIETLYNSL